MPRFPSLTYVPAVTRGVLRDRLARFLPLQHDVPAPSPSPSAISDEALLALMLHLRIEVGHDLEWARAAYEGARVPGSAEPTFDELIASGWVRVVWGRVSIPFEMVQAARRAPPGSRDALTTLLSTRFGAAFRIDDGLPDFPELESVAPAITRGEVRPDTVRSADPKWVAARLWERSTDGPTEGIDGLRLWVDRWRELGRPPLVPSEVWTEDEAEAFCEAAFTKLESEPSLRDGWEKLRRVIVAQFAAQADRQRRGLGNTGAMLAALRGELLGQSSDILRRMLAALTDASKPLAVGTSRFSAALDILDIGSLGDAIDPVPIVSAYIRSLETSDYMLAVSQISDSNAVSLVKLAMTSAPEPRRRFFAPVDVMARLAEASAPDANPFTIADEICRSLRVHIRTLGRAIAGMVEPPDELVDALVDTVRAGALSHVEKGRVGALSVRYETEPFRGQPDRSIAADLGGALRALSGDRRERLLTAILETDEPVVLAQLLTFAPRELRPRIVQRVHCALPSRTRPGPSRVLGVRHASTGAKGRSAGKQSMTPPVDRA